MRCDADALLEYLNGTLPPDSVEQLEAHLLSCDTCWTAVVEDRHGRDLARAGREVAPPGLAERIRAAINLEDLPPPRGRRPVLVLVLALAAAVVVAVGLSTLSEAGNDHDDVLSVAVALVDDPSVRVDRIDVDGVPVAVAASDRPFPMPAGAHALDGTSDVWTAQHGDLTVVCVDQPAPRLVVGSLSPDDLLDLAR